MDDFWPHCLQKLEHELSAQQFSAWIRPLVMHSYDADKATLRVIAPTMFKLNWVRKNYAGRFAEIASEWYETPVQVVFELNQTGRAKGAVPAAPDSMGVGASANKRDFSALPPAVGSESASALPSPAPVVPTKAEEAKAIANAVYERSRLNVDLTFDSFVTGKANQMARAAAFQVSENPGVSFNPLYLYGGVGLGKTHLLHAVGNAMLEKNPQARIRYLSAVDFVEDVVNSYKTKAFDEFKRMYHSLDLLLIDDIQFFAEKKRSQEEFFYAFEALVALKNQIIITSDTYPKELKDIDERLLSRFDSGLTVGIEPPELEMRVAILFKKAEADNVRLSEDAAFFIAKNLRSNVRELEGALRKVIAYTRFHNKDITVEMCKDALKDLLSVSNSQLTVEKIQKTVADFYKIKVADMYSKRRPANIALPRQIAMYLSKELTNKSLPEIGDLFGGRDHTTVLHAVRKIGADRTKNAELNHSLHVLEQTLKG